MAFEARRGNCILLQWVFFFSEMIPWRNWMSGGQKWIWVWQCKLTTSLGHHSFRRIWTNWKIFRWGGITWCLKNAAFEIRALLSLKKKTEGRYSKHLQICREGQSFCVPFGKGFVYKTLACSQGRFILDVNIHGSAVGIETGSWGTLWIPFPWSTWRTVCPWWPLQA